MYQSFKRRLRDYFRSYFVSFQCRTLNAPFFCFFFQLSDKIGLSIKDRIVCYERKLDSWVSGLIVDTCIIKLNGVCLLHSIIYNRLWVDSPLGRGLVGWSAGMQERKGVGSIEQIYFKVNRYLLLLFLCRRNCIC